MRFPRHLRTLALWTAVGAGLLASGISTHFESADRARVAVDPVAYADLAAVLDAHPQEFRIGSVYPDWGYLWPRTAAAAESSHWAPFHSEAAAYLHETYGEPWSPHAERLFAFLCGFVAHGAMDEPWHFGSNAFLNRALQEDLDGWDPELAAWLIEPGVDLFVQADHRPGPEDLRWWIPAQDLVALSARAGHPEVGLMQVRRGSRIQRVGLWLEDLLGPSFAGLVGLALPWSRVNYESWPIGGLDDGSALATVRLQDYWDEYQLIASQPDAPVGGGSGVHHAGLQHQACAASGLLRVAAELLDQGVIEVPVRELAAGAIELGEPRVLDPDAFRSRIEAWYASGR